MRIILGLMICKAKGLIAVGIAQAFRTILR